MSKTLTFPAVVARHTCQVHGCDNKAMLNEPYCYHCTDELSALLQNTRSPSGPVSRLWAFVGFCLLLFAMFEIVCCCMAPGSLR